MNMRNKLAGRILLVEDDHEDAEKVSEFLVHQGYSVDYANDGISGLDLASSHTYDAIVLDERLPDIDGMTICHKLCREAEKPSSVLMLTARDTLEDKLADLEAGADGYLIKPFDIRELEARLHALIRRSRAQVSSEVLSIGDMTLDLRSSRVVRGGRELAVSDIGLKLLAILMRESPRVVSRREIERKVWGHLLPDPDILRSHVYRLRAVIDKSFDQSLFHKVGATGYCVADQSALAAINSPVSMLSPMRQFQTALSRTDKDSHVIQID